ncbi:MAG: heparan-alpha-glucosaminide N-acetyltransferase domain-containing protein [Candidatus Helarchaeota archaeon]
MSKGDSKAIFQRIHGIDIMRGFAILIMIWVHFTMFFSYNALLITNFDGVIYGILTHSGFISAPFFFTVSGLSLGIATMKRREAKKTERKIFSHVLKRGTLVILLGYSFSFIRSFWFLTPDRIFNLIFFWDLLHSLGLLMILTYFTLFLRMKYRVILAVGLLVMMSMMTYLPLLFGYPLFLPLEHLWLGMDYLYVPRFASWTYLMQGNMGLVLINFIIQILWCGNYPIMPWIFFNILGTIVADIIVRYTREKNLQGMKRRLMHYSYVLITIGWIIFIISNFVFPLPLHVDPIFYCLECISGFMLMFYGFYRLADYKGFDVGILAPIEYPGKLPLTIYFMHGVIIGVLLDGLNLVIPIRSSFFFPWALIPIIGFFLGFIILARFWNGYENRYSLDWMLSKIH